MAYHRVALQMMKHHKIVVLRVRYFRLASLLLLVFLSACTLSTDWTNDAYSEPGAQLPPSEKVAFWQEKLLKKPKDTHLLVRLNQARQHAVVYYLRQGQHDANLGNYDQAMAKYQQGLLLDSEAQVLKDAIATLNGKQQAMAWLAEAQVLEKQRANL